MSLSREQEDALRQLARDKGWLENSDGIETTGRPQLKLPADDREHHDFARELGEIVVKTDLLFRRGETPVTVSEETKALVTMSGQAFRTWVSEFVACYREKRVRVGDDVKLIRKIRTMDLDTAHAVLASKHFWQQLPEIKRLNTMRLPIIRADKKIELLAPGYFAEQGIYTLKDKLEIDETMTLEQARKVIDELKEFFPYKTPRSKAASLAAGLTMYCASMLPPRALRPAFVCTANTKGAGKTLDLKCAVIPVVGSCAPRSLPRKEEAKKVLDVAAMEAAPYIFFDNIRGKIQGEEIESFITAAEWEARPLGESSKVIGANCATVFLTGNQSTTSEDMADRCLLIELFVEEADNRDRRIPRIIDDEYLALPETRSRTCSAYWAFVRAWDADGRPEPPSYMPRFEKWSAVVPAIIHFVGYGDCLERADISGVGDELRDMRALVFALAPTDEEPQAEKEFTDLVNTISELDLFEEMQLRSRREGELFDSSHRATMAARATFGKLFERFDGRLFRFTDRNLRFRISGTGDAKRFVISREA